MWLSGEPRPAAGPGPTVPGLPGRQREVPDLLVWGAVEQGIGRALDVTVDGAKAHLKAIDLKLGVTDRTEAIVAAIRLGLVRVT